MSFKVERDIAEAVDWYQVHRVVEGYKKMTKLLKHDMGMTGVWEVHYEQNLDSGYFRTELIAKRNMGTGNVWQDVASNVELWFDIVMYTRQSPTKTDDGWFGILELNPIAKLVVEMPGKPDRFADKLFRRMWYNMIFHEQFNYYADRAEEELNRYINEVRNFYGLEPTTAKTERLGYRPLIYGNI